MKSMFYENADLELEIYLVFQYAKVVEADELLV
jgi:hypothetical protein